MVKYIRLGSKYYKYDSNKNLIVYRALEVDDKNDIVKVWSYFENKIIDLPEAEFDYLIRLRPDAKLDIMITSYSDPTKKDVYAWIYRSSNIIAGNIQPQVMLRQDIYNQSRNMFDYNIKWVGDCLTDLTNFNHVPLTSLADFNSVDFSYNIDIYITDTLNDIMMTIPKNIQDKFDQILSGLTKYNNDQIKGYCSTLRELFENNGLIGNFRSIFNITQVDILIDNSNPMNITISQIEKDKLEQLLHKRISISGIIQFNYNIELKDLSKLTHIIISDKNEIIYIIFYKVIEEYQIDEDTADVYKALGLQTASREEIEQQFGVTL